MAPTQSHRPLCPPFAVLVLATILATILSGCLAVRRYDMTRIHREAAARPRNPVIVLHGFLGSRMKNLRTHQSVWGRVLNAVRRGDPDDLALPIDRLPLAENRDDLVPYEICDAILGVKFYGSILDSLVQVGGYRLGDIDDPRPDDTVFVFNYDWRRDNVEAAIALGRAIRKIKARLQAPEMRFDIVAHSMGGLIAEYYLKYGAEDVLDRPGEAAVTWAGAPDIGRIVAIGTPHQGTMSAFRILNNGISRTLSPRELFTMPSVYQLLPTTGAGHFLDMDGREVAIDLYDAQTWIRNRWSIWSPREAEIAPVPKNAGRFLQASLDRARAFRAALDREGPGAPPLVPINLFGSDCIPTLDRVLVDPLPGGTRLLFTDGTAPFKNARELERLMLAPGDGTVTADSLTGMGELSPPSPVASTFFFCATHGLLPANRGFQGNLFYVLLGDTPRPLTGNTSAHSR
jgi:pimeloyl-ACP methyl ester carboxylesterase